MRIIAGKYRSRVLRSLRGLDLRPTADRLRETLFSVLCAGNPDALAESVWIDLFAGTGAVGIEALSRGAAEVYFVESSTPAAELIKTNLDTLGAEPPAHIVKQDAMRALRSFSEQGLTADFVFLDPPYRMETTYAQVLEFLSDSKLVKPGTRIIAEHSRKFALREEIGRLRRYRMLEQGDAALSFFMLADTAASECATLAT